MTYKYTDSTNTVVSRSPNGGGIESCLVSNPEVQAWIAEGNTPEPADAPDLIAEAKARIRALEEEQVREMARMTRDMTLAQAEAMALADYGLTPAQLYDAGKAPGASIAALNYAKLKDIDNAIKVEREKFA